MAEPKENLLMEKIVSLCKRRGFIFQSSEIYGGINGFWDYGPLGAELKRNVKELWWHAMTRQRDDVAGLEATIIMSPKIWEASGHVDTFADLMVECPVTKKRYRADQIEPQSGIVYHYSGAIEDQSKYAAWLEEKNLPKLETLGIKNKPTEVVRPFSVLIQKANLQSSHEKSRLNFILAAVASCSQFLKANMLRLSRTLCFIAQIAGRGLQNRVRST